MRDAAFSSAEAMTSGVLCAAKCAFAAESPARMSKFMPYTAICFPTARSVQWYMLEGGLLGRDPPDVALSAL
jgi:hypothetical protein